MKKLLLINSVCGIGSTGRICLDIAKQYDADGYDVKIAYGRDGKIGEGSEKYAVRIGTDLDAKLHALYTRITDKHGLGSKHATKEFLKWADEYDPDIVWLHNIHGYYINYELLFNWIKNNRLKHKKYGKHIMEVKWTLHDCWAFTGHCSYFSFIGCDKWKTKCCNCPQRKEYPTSYFIDNSTDNYSRKKNAFLGIDDLEIIVPSEWLKELVEMSFFKQFRLTILRNSIDTSIFIHTDSDFRKKYNLGEKIVVLGVAYVWDNRKGFNTFIELSKILNEKYKVVMVGLNNKQIKNLPKTILGLPKTNSKKKLAEIYSAADIYLNPSYEETFGMTTMEAQACGTYTMVYKGTACEEISDGDKGCAINPGVESIKEEIYKIFQDDC